MNNFTLACAPVVAFITSFVFLALGLTAPQRPLLVLLVGIGTIMLVCASAITVHVLARQVNFRSVYAFARWGVIVSLGLSALVYAHEWVEHAWSFKGF